MPKKGRRWNTAEIVDVYFPGYTPRLPPDLLLLILEFSGMVGNHFFWVYF